jgi:hypothetical protein
MTALEPPPLQPDARPSGRRRSTAAWCALLVIWSIGLAVWAFYIVMLGAVFVRIL